MVKLGFTRAYGTSLRSAIAAGTKNRFIGFFCGAFATALLQSSTATTVLLTSFVKKHGIALSASLGVILGADVATTLVAQILSYDLSWLSPALLLAGVVMHLMFEHGGRKRHLARVMIGLGLMLLALTLIREASAPLKGSEILPLVMTPLKNDPVLAIGFAALLTWIFHSSLASVLLFASFAANGLLTAELVIMMVLGANIGSAFNIFVLTYKEGISARRITLAILGMKFIALAATIALLPYIIAHLPPSDSAAAGRLAVNFHTAFNLAVALAFLPLTSFVAQAMERLLPEKTKDKKPAIQYIEEHMLSTPVVALAAAARETLHMAELIEDMFKKTLKAFEKDGEALIKSIRKADNKVDTIYSETKLYLTRLSQEGLDPKEADRYIQILTFATNLEHIGDIIDKSLMDMAAKKAEKQESFSKEGFKEIKDFHGRVLENMKLAQAIFMSEDPKLAAQLVEEKGAIRAAANETSDQHFRRLQSGKLESIATSSLHLDIVRDFRRINSYITRVAFAIIENAETHKGERKGN